jgi:predicted transglutaminase-like cysteine proteinase
MKPPVVIPSVGMGVGMIDSGRAIAVGAALAGVAMTASPTNAQAIRAGATAVPDDCPKSLSVAPKLFGTVARPVTAKRFSDEWERARRDASTTPEMRQLIAPAAHLGRQQQIAYVQSAVMDLIAWRSDATVWGRHDYWASAAETLSRGTGDIEDRAIVKMQALRAMGFPTHALYMTLGRDKVAGPQAVLVVCNRGRYYLLDDTGAAPYTPDERPEFTPFLTFGYGTSWVHVSRVPEATSATGASKSETAANR